MKLAVTGATGFVGQELARELTRRGIPWVDISRAVLADAGQLAASLAGCTAAIHLAAIAHRMGASAPSPDEFTRINRDLAVNFGRACATAGVRRFVFVSTIGVVSDRGQDVPLRADAPLAPASDYARTKAEAEQALAAIDGLDVVSIRPPLVYAPGAPGNLRLLEKLARLPLPLPIGGIRNARHLVGRANLVDALIFLASAPVPAGVVHVRDDATLSLADLIGLMRRHHGRPAWLLPFPAGLARLALRLGLGGRRAQQLTGDFLVDDSGLRALGWVPPHPAGFDYAKPASKLWKPGSK